MSFRDVLRIIVVAEITGVLFAYAWAFVGLIRQRTPADRVLRLMRLGRLCRVGAVLITLTLADLSVFARWEQTITWQLIPWQLALFGFFGAWALLDRVRYYPPRHDETAPAASRALVKLAEARDD